MKRELQDCLWPLLGIALLLILSAFYGEHFFALEWRDGRLYGSLIDVLNQGSKIILVALGMTLVIATGGVDLSVGSVMALAGAVAASFAAEGYSALVILLASLIAGGLVGCFNGSLVSFLGVQPIVATLISMISVRGLAMAVSSGQIMSIENKTLLNLGTGAWLGLPISILMTITTLVVLFFFSHKTAAFWFISTVGSNQKSGVLVGLPVNITRMLCYLVCSFCAVLAGWLACGNIKAADSVRAGEYLELDAIFAVLLGGTALNGGKYNLLGSFIGALFIQLLNTTMYSLGVPPTLAMIPKALLILVVSLLQSNRFRSDVKKMITRNSNEVRA